MSVWSCNGCWRTGSSSRPRSACSTRPPWSSWDTSWRRGRSGPTPRRNGQLHPAPALPRLWQILPPIYPRFQLGRDPTDRPNFDPPSLLLDPGGRGRIPEEPVHLGPGAHPSPALSPVHRGGGRIGCRHQVRTLPAVGGGPARPPCRLSALTVLPGRGEL